MILPNPYMVRFDHPSDCDISEFRETLKRTRNVMCESWGYSDPAPEGDYETFGKAGTPVSRSYWVFTNDMDALHFRLTIGERARRVTIWPVSRKFTIYEFSESDE